MNDDAPWKPPTGDGPVEAAPPTGPAVPPPPPAPSPQPEHVSPWSPDGAATWTRPDAVPQLPETPAAAPSVPTGWESPGHAGAPAAGVPAPEAPPVPVAPATPTDARTKRSKAAVGATVGAVAALGLAGVFMVNRWTGGDDAGGAATPEELGANMMAAMEAEDVLGIIDTMLPGERDSLGDPFVELIGELQRLDLLAPDTDLSALAGLDIELTDEAVEVVATNAPDIVGIHMSADALVTFDGATVPIGELIEAQLTEDQLLELRNTRVAETDELDVTMTAVLQDDQWYFSLFHTLAEELRGEAGDPPIPLVGVAVTGGETPEEAFDGLLDEIEGLDLAGIIGSMDPAEAMALQRYAPIFLDDAQAALDEAPLEWRIDERSYRVDGSGSQRTVFVDALGISGAIEGSPFRVRIADGCLTAEFEGERIEECADGTGDVGDEMFGDEMFGDAAAVGDFVAALEEAFADVEDTGIELRERDGRWYVSPLATGTEAMLNVLRALDREELEELIDLGTEAVGDLFDVFDDGFVMDMDAAIDDGYDDSMVVEEPADEMAEEPADEAMAEEEPADGSVIEDEPVIVIDDMTPGTSAWERCYESTDAATAATCFADAVATGELIESDVPAVLRHPECGVAEVLWSGGVYELDDATFAATIGPAVDCFDGLVAAGELESWEVPFEVTYYPCFEDRNWFTVFDDAAYNERVATCLDSSEGD